MRCYVTIAFLAVIAVAISGCSQDTTKPSVSVEAHMDDLIDTQASGPPGLRVIPPDASPHGRTYAEWSAAWWAWLWSAPVDVNPGLDETGENITYGQSGNVWFLAPAYFGTYERWATIPSGKMLFVDLAGWFNSPRVSDYETEEDLRAEIEALTDQITNIIFEVDGTRLEQVENYRVQTPPGFMEYTLPEVQSHS